MNIKCLASCISTHYQNTGDWHGNDTKQEGGRAVAQRPAKEMNKETLANLKSSKPVEADGNNTQRKHKQSVKRQRRNCSGSKETKRKNKRAKKEDNGQKEPRNGANHEKCQPNDGQDSRQLDRRQWI